MSLRRDSNLVVLGGEDCISWGFGIGMTRRIGSGQGLGVQVVVSWLDFCLFTGKRGLIFYPKTACAVSTLRKKKKKSNTVSSETFPPR